MSDSCLADRGEGRGKVLVAGGGGYLGSVLTGQLLERGHTVRVLDRFLFGEESLEPWQDHPNLHICRGDVRDLGLAIEALEDAEAVIMLAAVVGEQACDRDPRETLGVNYLAPVAMAEACAQVGTPRFIFASTDSAYGIQEGIMTEESALNPISLYARLKGQVEQKILPMAENGFAPCVLRLATLYGLSPRMRFDLIVNLLTMHAATQGRFTIYGGKQWRPLVHVADVARAFVMALEAPLEKVRGQIFNVGSNEQNVQIYQLGDIVSRVIPTAARTTTDVPPDLRDYHVSFDKMGRELGYKVQFQITDGVREIQEAIVSGRISDPYSERYRNA